MIRLLILQMKKACLCSDANMLPCLFDLTCTKPHTYNPLLHFTAYFDTPVLSGRTRSQGSKGQKEGPMSGTPVSSSPASAQLAAQSAKLASKEETGETTTSVSGAKRSTRSLRAKGEGLS